MTSAKNKMSPFAEELRQSMQESIDYLKGEGTARETRLTLPEPPPKMNKSQIRALRMLYDLTQIRLARLINVSPKTIQGWEQGIRVPCGAALRLLQMIGERGVDLPDSEPVRRKTIANPRLSQRTANRKKTQKY